MKTNKKVLIMVSGGIATAYADQGVDVVIVDYDDYKADPHETPIVHSGFLPLMNFAKENGAWPVWLFSDDGRINDAYVVPGLSPEYIISFKDFSEEMPIVGKPLLCKMADHTGKKQMILSLSSNGVMDTEGLLNRQFFLLSDVKQWAYLPEDRNLAEELLQFTGSVNWYEHPLNSLMTYTDGVKYFVDQTDSHWLLDGIATECFPMQKDHLMLVITVVRLETGCRIVVSDPNEEELKSKDMNSTTSIPEGTWRFYLTNNVLLLPSEY